MVKKLKYDRRKVSQELESAFLGSGDNVIPVETIERIKNEDIRDPEDMFVGNQLWVWEKPKEGHIQDFAAPSAVYDLPWVFAGRPPRISRSPAENPKWVVYSIMRHQVLYMTFLGFRKKASKSPPVAR